MKKLLSIILSITMLLSMATVAFADGIDGPPNAKLTVGINAEYAPFEYYEDGELTGFDIDLMNYIGERIGCDIDYVDMSFDALIPAVVSGKVDCAISAITVTEERENVVDFTRPYLAANVTYNDGDSATETLEKYAVVFPNNSIEKAKLIKASGDTYMLYYTLVDNAIKELIDDATIQKLMTKYEKLRYEYMVIKSVDTEAKADLEISKSEEIMAAIPAPSDWAEESITIANEWGITYKSQQYNYKNNITREEFCELIYNLMIATKNDVTVPITEKFTDTKNKTILILNALGIINGKSETEFAPDDYLTREEAATIIIRMINKVIPMAATEMWFEYDDIYEISEWASDSIQTISNLGFMNGVGNNKFAPKDNFTTEQAIATIVRVYNGFNPQKSNDKWENLTFTDKLNVNMPACKNYMFSPLSIKMALMMAANGASGTTKEEILKAIGIEDLEVYNESVRLMLDKYSESDILKLNVSNSIWINSDKTTQRFSKDYTDKLSKTFDAAADVVTDKNAVSEINGWVNEKTEGKIPTIITEDNKDFWAMLVNAVYFKGRWQNEFNKGATQKDVFTSRDSSQTEIDFMNRNAWMSYANTDGVSIVALPYLTRQDVFDENGEYIETKKLDGVNISMYLMMSEGSFLPEEVLSKAEMDVAYIALSVPKFNIEYSTGLNDILKTIGIRKAFEEDAEFDKMFDGGSMWIDSTIHKTYVKVDEEGTEAAAVTAVGMAGSAMPPEPIEVKFNKPFTFVIKDNTNGEILFMGEYAFAE